MLDLKDNIPALAGVVFTRVLESCPVLSCPIVRQLSCIESNKQLSRGASLTRTSVSHALNPTSNYHGVLLLLVHRHEEEISDKQAALNDWQQTVSAVVVSTLVKTGQA